MGSDVKLKISVINSHQVLDHNSVSFQTQFTDILYAYRCSLVYWMYNLVMEVFRKFGKSRMWN